MSEQEKNDDRTSTSAAERIEIVRSETKLSMCALARELEVKSQSLYHIKRGVHGISYTLAEKINNRFPEFSVAWLVGVEKQSKRARTSRAKVLPYYYELPPRSELVADAEPDRYMNLSATLAGDAELVTLYNGPALVPYLVGRMYVLLKHVKQEYPGQLCLIETNEMMIYRRITRTNSSSLHLCPVIPDNTGDIVIAQNKVRALYKVCGVFFQPEI